jgi:hypothetical protein
MGLLVTMFWVLDIFNFKFMEMFDTTYPLNGWFWFVVFLVEGFCTASTSKSD